MTDAPLEKSREFIQPMLTGMGICHAETGAVKLFLLRSESIPWDPGSAMHMASRTRIRTRNLCVVALFAGAFSYRTSITNGPI